MEGANSVVLSVIVKFIWSTWKGHGGLPAEEGHDLNIFYINLDYSVSARCVVQTIEWCAYL